MKPIIGIVGRCQNNDGYSLIGVVDQLRNAVIKCGGNTHTNIANSINRI